MALTRSTIQTCSLALVATVMTVVLALPSAPWARERLPGPIKGEADVVSVHDGDTLAVRARIWLGQEISTKVRLAEVHTPELRGRCHRERRMAEAARDFVRGEDLGEALIAAGLGRPYRGRQRASWCEQAQSR